MLFNTNQPFDPANQSESVQNIGSRAIRTLKLFPEELEPEHAFWCHWLAPLPMLTWWRSFAYSDEDAYIVFETMNDRGLIWILQTWAQKKGYCYQTFRMINKKNRQMPLEKTHFWNWLNKQEPWCKKTTSRKACKTWIRAKHAVTIREPQTRFNKSGFDR